jgi:transposase
MALDITSISSYSEFIGDVEWGYNRDNEKLPQINVCMLFGEDSGLPIFQTTYSGSLTDVSTLKTTLQLASGLSLNNISIVMDRGFSRKDNIDTMLKDEDGIRFLIAVPLTLNFTKEQINSERTAIDSVDNTIVIGDDVIRGTANRRMWNNDFDVYAHSFFNAELAYQSKNRLYGYIAKLKAEAVKNPGNSKFTDDFEKYLIIRKNRNNPTYSVKVNHAAIEKELQHKGWFILVSNHIDNANDAIEIYRAKDIVEKGFLKMKNCLDLGRLRVHSDHRMQSKLFIGFVALIIMAHIHKVMAAHNMYESYTISKMLKNLERLRVQYVNGDRIIFPLTAEQKYIFKAFGVAPPV